MESGGKGRPVIDQDEAVALMKEKYEIARSILHGFDYQRLLQARPEERLKGLADAMDFILRQEDGKKRFVRTVSELSKAFALAVPHEEALAIRDEVGLFQDIRVALVKTTGGPAAVENTDGAVRQLISQAVSGRTVVDIFAAAGLKKPDISILSDEFLAEMRDLPQKNLAVEALQKLLREEIKSRLRRNVVQSRAFSEMLQEALNRYHNRTVQAAQVIEELISIAKELREAQRRGEKLGLSEDEVAFYDALADNGSAVEVLGDDTLKKIAHELVEVVRRNVTVDWSRRENIRAQLRVLVKRILRKYGYPPDRQEKATELVLQQTEVLGSEWTSPVPA